MCLKFGFIQLSALVKLFFIAIVTKRDGYKACYFSTLMLADVKNGL